MNLFPGSYQSPDLRTDPRGKTCDCGCGQLLYPGEVCQARANNQNRKMLTPKKRRAEKESQ